MASDEGGVDEIQPLKQPDNQRSLLENDNEENTSEQPKALEKTVGLSGALSLIVGVMIGSGIFASPKAVFSNAGSVGMGLAIWGGCGLLAMMGSLCYAELGTTIRESGGETVYLRKIFGRPAGFLYSWTSVLIIKPSTLAAVAVAFAQYILEPFFPGCQSEPFINPMLKCLAACVLLVVLFVNCCSVNASTRVQVIFTVAKLLALVIIILTGLVRLGQGHTSTLESGFDGTTNRISKIGYAFYGGLWAFDGWNNLNYLTEELKNPLRDLPLAIIIGIPFVTTFYILVNIAYLTVLSYEEIKLNTAVAVTLANQLYGVMAWIIPVFVACSTFGTINGICFSSSRIVYATARDGQLPRVFSMMQRKRRTPQPALFFETFVALLMLIPESSNFETLINYFSFAAWTFYGITTLGLIWSRYRYPKWERPYKVFIGIPMLVFLCSIYLVVAPFYDYPLQSFYCLLFILAGCPVYYLFVYRNILPKSVLNMIDKLQFKIEALGDFVPTLEKEVSEAQNELENLNST